MQTKTEPIYVVVCDGTVEEVKNIPQGSTLQVIDKDVEYVPPDDWAISPLDGEACTIRSFPE